jgi:transcriptional regulator with XRE-family HTH domain
MLTLIRHRYILKRLRGNKMDIGAAIKLVRISRNYSHETLAEKTGLSLGLISLLETGRRLPGMATLYTISQALDVPLTLIFFLTEQDRVETLNPDAARELAISVINLMGPVDDVSQGLLELAKRIENEVPPELRSVYRLSQLEA